MAHATFEHNVINDSRTIEAEKTAIEKGEDWIYMLNHAFACITTDFLNTPFELLTKNLLGKEISISQCPACQTGEHKEGMFGIRHNNVVFDAGRWIVAENIGDVGGILPTLMMQRHAPQVMNGIGQALTYVMGDAFKWGAKHSANGWADRMGIDKNAPEVRERADEIYSHEIKHIAQAFVWGAFSTAITVGALKAMNDETPTHAILAAKLVGMSTSFFGLLGARAAFPDAAQKWDRWGSEHIATPLTQIVGGAFGVEKATIEKVIQQKDAAISQDAQNNIKPFSRKKDTILSNELTAIGR
jgi:hypothetical protein